MAKGMEAFQAARCNSHSQDLLSPEMQAPANSGCCRECDGEAVEQYDQKVTLPQVGAMFCTVRTACRTRHSICNSRLRKNHMNNLSILDQYRPRQNTLLGALPAAELGRLAHDLELVPLALGQVLYETGQTMNHAYFPLDCIVSLLYVMENGDSAEIAIIGNEGMIGISLFMGGESTQNRAIVQNAGHAYRLKSHILKQEFNAGGSLQRHLLLFASALMTQMVQTAACNRHHSVDQQLCRWMLLSLDRLPSNQISMTQKLIGNMLGISGASVIAAAGVLQKKNLIRYDHGQITVLDRSGVEKRSCECYSVVKTESDRLLPLSGALDS